jgi:hypothetical protein
VSAARCSEALSVMGNHPLKMKAIETGEPCAFSVTRLSEPFHPPIWRF